MTSIKHGFILTSIGGKGIKVMQRQPAIMVDQHSQHLSSSQLTKKYKKEMSQQHNATISDDRLPLYPASSRTAQENATIGDLICLSHSLQRRRIDHPLHGPRIAHRRCHGRIDQSRTNTIDPNLVFRIINSVVARQGYNGGF
jgi:hypothetical protein